MSSPEALRISITNRIKKLDAPFGDAGVDNADQLSGLVVDKVTGDAEGEVIQDRAIEFTDEQLKELFQRGAVIGAPLDAWMMIPDWRRGLTTPEARGLRLDVMVDHIDHICQLAGNSRHCGMGTDLDGGFGKEQCPKDLDTIADLHKIAEILARRGYSQADIDGAVAKAQAMLCSGSAFLGTWSCTAAAFVEGVGGAVLPVDLADFAAAGDRGADLGRAGVLHIARTSDGDVELLRGVHDGVAAAGCALTNFMRAQTNRANRESKRSAAGPK